MARSITVIPAKQISIAESGTAQSVQKLKMAAYCRVSTDQEEQLLSYENQVNYYTNYISENPLYEYAGTYADEGISGTNTKKRDEFNRMIADCQGGKNRHDHYKVHFPICKKYVGLPELCARVEGLGDRDYF